MSCRSANNANQALFKSFSAVSFSAAVRLAVAEKGRRRRRTTREKRRGVKSSSEVGERGRRDSK